MKLLCRWFSTLAKCASVTLLILLIDVDPAGARCCQLQGSCENVGERACRTLGGRWSRCADCVGSSCVWLAFAPETSTLDTDPPMCRMTGSRKGPPAQIDITVQDTESGLAEITVLTAENVLVPLPSFVAGTTDPVVVTATKDKQSLPSRVMLGVGDVGGNCTTCDPVLTQVVRGKGRENKEQSFANIDAAEDIVTVDNGIPGLTSLEVQVNGINFRLSKLSDGESRTLDVSSAMLPGSQNIFTLRSHGKLGSEAMVLIWDGNGTPGDPSLAVN